MGSKEQARYLPGIKCIRLSPLDSLDDSFLSPNSNQQTLSAIPLLKRPYQFLPVLREMPPRLKVRHQDLSSQLFEDPTGVLLFMVSGIQGREQP